MYKINSLIIIQRKHLTFNKNKTFEQYKKINIFFNFKIFKINIYFQ